MRPPLPVAPPVRPPLPATVTAPVGTSSPRSAALPTNLPVFSPISDAETPLSDINKSKVSIVAPESTINASSIMGTSVLPASSPAKVEIVQKTDIIPPISKPDVDIIVQPEIENVLAQSQESIGNPSAEAVDAVKSPTLFPENSARLPAISHARRVSLAYKYCPFPPREEGPVGLTSEARGSGEETEDKPEEIAQNSFPISSFILNSWQDRGKNFKKTLEKALIMKPKPPPAENVDPDAEDDGAKVIAEKSDGFAAYSDSVGSIFANKPIRQQQNFYYHEEKFAPFVKRDGNLGVLMKPDEQGRKKDPKSWKPQLTLHQDDIQNVQTALSYGLHAESHSSAYVRASRLAINSVLESLDPALHAESIAKLRDVKAMLFGVVKAIEQSVEMSVYVHSGLTTKLRAEFLNQQDDYLPMHVKQELLHSMFGGTYLFNSQIHKFAEEIDRHNAKQAQSRIASAVAKMPAIVAAAAGSSQQHNKNHQQRNVNSAPKSTGQFNKGFPKGGRDHYQGNSNFNPNYNKNRNFNKGNQSNYNPKFNKNKGGFHKGKQGRN